MSEPDDETPPPSVQTLSGEAAQAALHDALQGIAQAFNSGAGSAGGLGASLQALGRLADPHVREQITAAFAQLQQAGAPGETIQTHSTVIDLRGTDAGMELRGLVERFGASGLSALPGVVVHTDADEAEGGSSLDTSAIVSAAQTRSSSEGAEDTADWTEAVSAPMVSEAVQDRREEQAVVSQPSLVEDAGGGLFGWLGRLFSSR